MYLPCSEGKKLPLSAEHEDEIAEDTAGANLVHSHVGRSTPCVKVFLFNAGMFYLQTNKLSTYVDLYVSCISNERNQLLADRGEVGLEKHRVVLVRAVDRDIRRHASALRRSAHLNEISRRVGTKNPVLGVEPVDLVDGRSHIHVDVCVAALLAERAVGSRGACAEAVDVAVVGDRASPRSSDRSRDVEQIQRDRAASEEVLEAVPRVACGVWLDSPPRSPQVAHSVHSRSCREVGGAPRVGSDGVRPVVHRRVGEVVGIGRHHASGAEHQEVGQLDDVLRRRARLRRPRRSERVHRTRTCGVCRDDSALADRPWGHCIGHDANLEVAVLIGYNHRVTSRSLTRNAARSSRGGRERHADAARSVCVERALDHALTGLVVEGNVLLVEHQHGAVGSDGRWKVGRAPVRQRVRCGLEAAIDACRRGARTQHEQATAQKFVPGSDPRRERQSCVHYNPRRGSSGVRHDPPLFGLTGHSIDQTNPESQLAAAAPVRQHVDADRCRERRRKREGSGRCESRRQRANRSEARNEGAGAARCERARRERVGDRELPRLGHDVESIEHRVAVQRVHERAARRVVPHVGGHGHARCMRVGRRGDLRPHHTVNDFLESVCHIR